MKTDVLDLKYVFFSFFGTLPEVMMKRSQVI